VLRFLPGLLACFDLGFATRCCGGLLATTPAARSKRCHASGCNSISFVGTDFAMPQPLSRVLPRPSVRLGNVGDYPLQRHPDLAHLVAEVIVSWGNVESFMLRLFIDLMGGPKDRAAAVFLALEIQSAKNVAINAVASRLPQDQQSLLRAILALIRTNQKSRDKIAHWTWGDSPQIPDALLLANPKDQIDTGLNYDEIFIYKAKDFTDIIRSNERLAGFGLQFRFILMDHPANRGGELFAELCAEPEIQERLSHQA
jgi:hypothetical protein